MRALQAHAGQHRAGQGKSGTILDLATAADHAAATAAEDEDVFELALEQGGHGVEVGRVLGAHEHDRQIRFLTAQAEVHGLGGMLHSGPQGVIGVDGGCPAHSLPA